jgi:hypothetical protein
MEEEIEIPRSFQVLESVMTIDLCARAKIALESLLLLMFYNIPENTINEVLKSFDMWLDVNEENNDSSLNEQTTLFWKKYRLEENYFSYLSHIALALDSTSTSETECERVFSKC